MDEQLEWTLKEQRLKILFNYPFKSFKSVRYDKKDNVSFTCSPRGTGMCTVVRLSTVQ
jgi:hypothetical protein